MGTKLQRKGKKIEMEVIQSIQIICVWNLKITYSEAKGQFSWLINILGLNLFFKACHKYEEQPGSRDPVAEQGNHKSRKLENNIISISFTIGLYDKFPEERFIISCQSDYK